MSTGQELQVAENGFMPVAYGEDNREFVTMRVEGQLLGISVLAVQDVLRNMKIAKVPLSPPVIEGSMNLRGRIVTVFNMRQRLGLPMIEGETPMHIVIDQDNELYSLMVDEIGDVLNLSMKGFEKTPVNLSSAWREIALGVFQLDKELLLILDTRAALKL